MDSDVMVAIVSGVVAIICAAFTGLNNWLTNRRTKKALIDNSQNTRLDALEDAMQCILRDQLIGTCEKYIKLEYCPMYVRDNIAHAYRTYHDLGGNGAITSLYEKAMALNAPNDDVYGGNTNED